MKITIKVRNAAGCRARAAAHRVTAAQRDAAGRPAHANMRRAAATRLDEIAKRIEARECSTGKRYGYTIGGSRYACSIIAEREGIIEIPANAVVISTATELRNGVEY